MSIIEQYEIGKPIFDKIFALPAQEVKKLVNEMTGNKDLYEDVFTNGTVYKKTSDDEPSDLAISSYDQIEISPLGIYYKPEHGTTEKIFEFNRFTKID